MNKEPVTSSKEDLCHFITLKVHFSFQKLFGQTFLFPLRQFFQKVLFAKNYKASLYVKKVKETERQINFLHLFDRKEKEIWK